MVGYADNVALVAREESELKEITKRLVEETHKMKLKLNSNECKVMRIGDVSCIGDELQIW